MDKPILCLDFDGVLHAYTSGWQGADKVTDGPVPGAVEFLTATVEEFRVAIYSTRSETYEGRTAMQTALHYWLCEAGADWRVFDQLEFPETKPPALITIDDRAVTFTGTFPTIDQLRSFRPWNKQLEQPRLPPFVDAATFLATLDEQVLVQELTRRSINQMGKRRWFDPAGKDPGRYAGEKR